jgi:hypothetical protein
MATHNFLLPLGPVNTSRLVTDEDFRREADRLLPDMLEKKGRAIGEQMLKQTMAALGGVSSASDRRRWVDEAGRNFRRDATAQDREEMRGCIMEQLRALKAASA